jgi:ATP-dependent Clp protease ATP-binding subunit ClpX
VTFQEKGSTGLLKIIEGTVASVPPKGGGNIPNRNSYKSIPTTSSSSVEGFRRFRKDHRTADWRKDGWIWCRHQDQRGTEHREVLREIQPEDLLRFGLIPEFIGRLPVIATLDDLNTDALVDILRKPKNALVKQYQKLFEFENVKLRFTEGALVAIAKEAIKRKSGARGLRAIMENTMLDVMYEIPSQSNIRECIISEEVVIHHESPILLYEKEAEVA